MYREVHKCWATSYMRLILIWCNRIIHQKFQILQKRVKWHQDQFSRMSRNKVRNNIETIIDDSGDEKKTGQLAWAGSRSWEKLRTSVRNVLTLFTRFSFSAWDSACMFPRCTQYFSRLSWHLLRNLFKKVRLIHLKQVIAI